jgi:alkylhydroperoxidase/carboxymuconolactone decarboxylase family protein YurZ
MTSPTSNGERRARGIAVYASQFGIPEAKVVPFMRARFGNRLTEEALSAAGGGTWTDDALSLRDRSLIVIAALVTLGGAESRMRPHVRWALEHGATADELEALTSLLAVYVGYPRSSAAAEVIREELRDLGRLGRDRGPAGS